MSQALLQTYIPSLAPLIVVSLGILLNNARINDLNTLINKRLDDLRSDTLARLERLETRQERLENILVGKLSEVESRLAKIESQLGLE